MKKKKAEDMKTSELIDELGTDLDDDRFTMLEDEFEERAPFGYYSEQIGELTLKIEQLEEEFGKHHHLKGKLVKEI